MRLEEPLAPITRNSARKPRRALRELVGDQQDKALTLIACHDARFWYPWHYHPEIEIKLIVQGQGTRYIGESIEPFEPGGVCIVGAGTPHCWNSPPVRGQWVQARVIQFLPELLVDFRELFDLSKLGLELLGAARAEGRKQIERVFAASTPSLRMAHVRKFLTIAADTRELRLLGTPRAVSQEQRAQRTLAQQVCEYLLARPTAPLTQSDVAEHFGLSVAGFSRFFTREFGKSFVRYRTELRVGHASHLLVEQELTMADVAHASGFGSIAGLDRHFRAVKGTTPTAYRQLARQMNHR